MHVTRVQERAEHGLLNVLLAHSVHTGKAIGEDFSFSSVY